jgi:hypothetical protein
MALAVSVLKMRDLLLRAKVVDEVQMRAALARLERYGGRLPKVLTDMGLIDEEQVTKVIAEALHLPLQALGAVRRDPDALPRLDVRLCEENGIFPVSLNLKTHTLVLAMAEPTALDVVDLVAARVNARVQTVVASESQIAAAIGKYYYGRAPSAVAEPNLARRAVTAQLPEEPSSIDRSASPAATNQGNDVFGRRPSANTLLDEMLGDPPTPDFSEADLARLESLTLTHEKTSTILRALRALLTEKGYLS